MRIRQTLSVASYNCCKGPFINSSRFLPTVTSVEVHDLDAMAAAMAGWEPVEFVQLEAGPFRGRWTSIRWDVLTVEFGHHDIAVVRRSRVPDRIWMFVVPLTMPAPARWNGFDVRGHELIALAPGAESYAFDPGGARLAIISLDRRIAADLGVAAPLRLNRRDSGLIQASPDALWTLRRQLAALATAIESRSPGKAADRAGRDSLLRAAKGAVIDGLRECLRFRTPAAPATGPCRARTEIVRQTEALVRGHAGEVLSIARLSAAAGVSERSLRNAFYEVYATSPKRFLRLLQLHQVRRVLRTADPARSTVTDVATCHGFFELGRFACEYKAFFGEPPSATLRSQPFQFAIA